MRSRSGVGRSLDASEELRQQLFDTWLSNEESHHKRTQASIAREYGIGSHNWKEMKKTRWFDEKKQAAGVE